MTAARPAKLYSPALLALATGLAAFPFDPLLPFKADARARTCGSTVRIAVALDQHDRITRIGLQMSACAIGQASAMLLAQAAPGVEPQRFAAVLGGLEVWLEGMGPLPDWPGLDALVPAREHPARHGALLLPWKAAVAALSTGATHS
jgi:NifU-like protein involved in Fe-S cluster formation